LANVALATGSRRTRPTFVTNCKTVAKATVVRIHYPPRAPCSAPELGKPGRGPIFVGPVKSRPVPLSTAIHGNMAGTLDHVSGLVRTSRLPSTRPSGSGHAPAPPRRDRRDERQPRWRRRGGSARLARVDGRRASRSQSAPAGGMLVEVRAWQEGPLGPTGACGSNGQEHDGRTTTMVIEDWDR